MPTRLAGLLLFSLPVLLVGVGEAAQAADWPHRLGPYRNNTTTAATTTTDADCDGSRYSAP